MNTSGWSQAGEITSCYPFFLPGCSLLAQSIFIFPKKTWILVTCNIYLLFLRIYWPLWKSGWWLRLMLCLAMSQFPICLFVCLKWSNMKCELLLWAWKKTFHPKYLIKKSEVYIDKTNLKQFYKSKTILTIENNGNTDRQTDSFMLPKTVAC